MSNSWTHCHLVSLDQNGKKRHVVANHRTTCRQATSSPPSHVPTHIMLLALSTWFSHIFDQLQYIYDIDWFTMENTKNDCQNGIWSIQMVGFVCRLHFCYKHYFYPLALIISQWFRHPEAMSEDILMTYNEGCASIQACVSKWTNTIPRFNLIVVKRFESSHRNGCLQTDGSTMT